MNIKFWKKKDPLEDLELPDLSEGFSPPNTETNNTPTQDLQALNNSPTPITPTYEHPPALTRTIPEQQNTESQDIKLQLIIANLETIKHQLEVINHRLEKLETKNQSNNPWYTKR